MEDNRTQKDESKRKLSSVFLFSNVSRKKEIFFIQLSTMIEALTVKLLTIPDKEHSKNTSKCIK
jgi:hypothetical protein